jgi:hypothetical protein
VLEHTVGVRTVDTAVGQAQGMDVAFEGRDLRHLCRGGGGLLDSVAVMIDADDRTLGSYRICERRQVSSRAAPKIQHHVAAADLELRLAAPCR